MRWSASSPPPARLYSQGLSHSESGPDSDDPHSDDSDSDDSDSDDSDSDDSDSDDSDHSDSDSDRVRRPIKGVPRRARCLCPSLVPVPVPVCVAFRGGGGMRTA